MSSDQKYMLSENPTEIERLSYNHRAIKSAFKKFISAPIDLAKSDLCILDSACADGSLRSAILTF